MNKEKEIEEMADVLWGHCGNLINEYCEGESHCANCIAKKLTEAGYRKADEVRKETAKEILQTIWDRFSRKISDEFGDMASDIKYITLDVEEVYDYLLGDLAEEYGAEVDE